MTVPEQDVPPSPPSPSSHLRNPPPFPPHPLLQIRSGRIKKTFGIACDSAIYKTSLQGPVPITPIGIPTDEHAYHDHGGPEMALLHYSSAHYANWKEELPSSEHLFTPGGFGENLVSGDLDERTVCIGDKIAIGDVDNGGVLVEVTQPRAPCFKLNHRFEVKDMAKRAQTQFRTGWMYKILRTGYISAGDEIRLVERVHPEWTVARVQWYLYHEKDNVEAMREIVGLEELGDSIKGTVRKRLEKGQVENMEGRMFGDEETVMDVWSRYTIVEKRTETKTVTAFALEAVDPVKDIVSVEPGSHVRLKLGGKLVRAYSVIGGTNKRFELGIALDANSRGGSKFLHTQTNIGDMLTVGKITASFPLANEAQRHIIIAGGIGITAFLAALSWLQDQKKDYELHFAVSSEIPFQSQIKKLEENARVYNKSLGQRLDLKTVFTGADENTHIYCCGPERLMSGVSDIAKASRIPESSVHFEQFTITTSGDPFTVELRESKKTIEVGPTTSLLDALKAVGLDIDSSCEVGNCGTCKVNLCRGRVAHRGTGLMEQEKGAAMLSCVSRGVGTIVLNL
ncbi:PK beta-barrel-protein domain-containing protein-like protein [Amniculicola lignicola CBS 123094]|uniref:PK beta-barrel-protein domain-containing protein-like protein n=1 Tax=Amniculicola lignicola CBS 123094 TaxID=1392246 RepID=A0A6A5WH86_9PLEO|nr:PK beta-barrel-protein domain-containing protein-like protein [Amniculicola lignicola CBS 123094]